MREANSITSQIKDILDFTPQPIHLSAYANTASTPNAPYPARNGAFGAGNTTVNIYSPKAVDAVQAAREWNKTAQRLAVNF